MERNAGCQREKWTLDYSRLIRVKMRLNGLCYSNWHGEEKK
jgi:hypothetical protein